MTVSEARARVEEALVDMQAAQRAIERADARTADLDALEDALNDAQRRHRAAATRLEHAQAVADARAAAPVQAIPDSVRSPRLSVGGEPLTYQPNTGPSFFRDVFRAKDGDYQAQERLQRHMREMQVERRALSSTDSAGGYLVPPLWLQEEFVPLARAGRPTINAITTRPLPPNTDSINIPTMASGTTVAAQTDNAAVSNTDATFGTVAADVKTIAGMQDVSLQVVDRGLPTTDLVIFSDLSKAFNTKFDSDVLTSSTTNYTGLLNVTGINAITYTSATPSLPGLYSKVADGIRQIETGIYAPPTAIFMHPRRWAWCLASLDSNNRPLVVPSANGQAFNAAGTLSDVVSEGAAGTLLGLPVYTDASIPTNLGGGTNEDRIIIARAQELYIWEAEGGPFLMRFDDVGSGTLTTRFRLHSYVAVCFTRRPAAISVISGAGLSSPAF